MIEIPSIETETPANIAKFQNTELRKTLHYVSANSPFYKERFEENGINISGIDLQSLSAIKPTTKDDLQQYNWDFLCVPKSHIAEYTSTSGTLGKPVTVPLTHNDMQRLAYNEQISFECAGGTSRDIYQLMLTLDRQFMAGIAYYHGIRKLGASVVRVGPGLPAMQIETIQRIKPTVLVAVPSFLVKLVEYATLHKIDLNSLSVERAICIGESIRTPKFSYNILGARIKENWNIPLLGTYASTEMQTAFTECEHECGGHHHPELIIVELLDDEDRPVRRGMPGEVTITTLGVEAMPLIRYKTGDIAIAFDEPCQCGRTTLRLGPLLGRKQQLIKLKGTTIYPPGRFEILNSIPCVKDFVIEAYTNDLGTDEIRLYLVGDVNYPDDVAKTVSAAMQSRLRVTPQINITTQESLDKMHSAGRKVNRFVDSRSVT